MPDAEADSRPPGPSEPPKDLLDTYRELRALARRLLLAERRGHTLGPTDLVHEAMLRLAGNDATQHLASADYRRLAAAAMRHVLIDHARARGSRKRGGDRRRISLDALELATTGGFDDILAVDDAIQVLERRDAGLAQIVRLRFFTGFTIEETAQALGTSPRTVNRDWEVAKALLGQILRDQT